METPVGMRSGRLSSRRPVRAPALARLVRRKTPQKKQFFFEEAELRAHGKRNVFPEQSIYQKHLIYRL